MPNNMTNHSNEASILAFAALILAYKDSISAFKTAFLAFKNSILSIFSTSIFADAKIKET